MALLGFDIGFTRPAMCIAICALCLRILFNYVLIYGKFGLPEMGGVGCSLANGIFNWLQVLMTILVVLRKLFYITGWRCILTV
jgi:MATE family multidrug resistance protein